MTSTPIPFVIQVKIASPVTQILVSGPIDERSDFSKAASDLGEAHSSGARELEIDVGGVDRLNSIGVKKWLTFLGQFQEQFKIRFDRISDAFVAQANVIAMMLGPANSPIRSFAAPYACDSCGASVVRELTPSQLIAPNQSGYHAPVLNCTACGGSLQLDEYEEEYFSFLKRHPKQET